MSASQTVALLDRNEMAAPSDHDGGRGEDDDDDVDEQVDYSSLSGLKEFTSETTMHGVQYVFRGSLLVRLLWLLGVLCALGGLFYFIVTAIDNYLDFTSNTKLNIRVNGTMPLPAVTICSVTLMQNRALIPSAGNPDAALNQAVLCKYYNIINSSGCPSARRIDEILRSDGRSAREMLLDVGQRKDSLILDFLVNNLTFPPVYVYAFSREFETIVTSDGLCHTFNSDGSYPALKSTGINNGAKFLVNIDQSQYAGVTVLSAGVEVYLHTPGEPIVRGSDAILIGPAQRANIGLKPQQRQLLGQPFNTPGCVARNINRNKSVPYSVAQCVLECQQALVVDICKCLPVTLLPGASLFGVTRPCSVPEFFNCSQSVALAFQVSRGEDANVAHDCRSRCLLPCNPAAQQFQYDFSLSWDLFPNSLAGEDILGILNGSGAFPDLPKGRDGLTYIRENFAQINVYYNELSYQSIVEQQAVTLAALFGSVGGNLGLFVGASMLTLLEFCQYLARVLLAYKMKQQEKRNKKKKKKKKKKKSLRVGDVENAYTAESADFAGKTEYRELEPSA